MIRLVVALPAEARPLINHYRLNDKQTHAAFPLYRNETMALVVSGPGKISAAAAAAWLEGCIPGKQASAWLNIGIAGHATHGIGSGLLANRISDHASSRSWFPPQVHDLDMGRNALLTVDSPENNYSGDTLYDMEASGFYPVACRFSTAELVQCFKIVSDNRQQSSTQVSAKLCTQLVSEQLESVDRVVRTLELMQQQYNSRHIKHPEHERMIGQWHFTVSQQHQLSRLLQRWTTLAPGQSLLTSKLNDMNTAAAVLAHLEQQLDV